MTFKFYIRTKKERQGGAERVRECDFTAALRTAGKQELCEVATINHGEKPTKKKGRDYEKD